MNHNDASAHDPNDESTKDISSAETAQSIAGSEKEVFAARSKQAPVPGQIGPYKILEVLGEGGMGVVYRAEQSQPRRQVALKLIRPGLVTGSLLRRFQLEADILARLQHPGIAQVYQADLYEGAPYFAMELIEGESLTEHARTQNLSIKQRLELFAKVCDAVQHAHQKGVVHRDLKPGNILVDTSGQPKILDFGVARATDGDIQTTTIQTDVGQLIGTIPYMSPEQASGDPEAIDTRSDVYALGVVLFELLAGRLPYDLSKKLVHEAVRIIQEDDPTRLSIIQKTLRGDVETIVGKALEKEKDRRYQSATAISADIRRYLSDQPVAARPPSASYQLRKFAKRNKALVTGAATVAVVLLAGVIASTTFAVGQARARAEAEDAQARATDEAATATHVSDFLVSMLQGVGPSVALGRDTTLLREIMDKTLERVDAELIDQPLVRARLLRVLGIVYNDLADYGKAEELVRRSAESARQAPGENQIAVARATYDVARILESTGRLDDAAKTFKESFDLYVEAGAGDTPDALSAFSNVGAFYYRMGRIDEAIANFRTTLEKRLLLVKGADDSGVASSMDRLSIAVNRAGKAPDEALRLARGALAMRRRLFGKVHPEIALSLVNLASILAGQGQLEEAIKLADESLEQHRQVYGARHPNTGRAMSTAGRMYEQAERPENAILLYNEALDIYLETLGQNHRQTLNTRFALGRLLDMTGDYTGAEDQFRGMLTFARASYEPGDNRTSNVIMLVAGVITKQGRHADAEPLHREAYEAQMKNRPEGHPRVALARDALASSLLEQAKFAEAEPLLLAGYARYKDPDSPDHASDAARTSISRIVGLYEAWNSAEPGHGYDEKAAEWRAVIVPIPAPATGSGNNYN